MKKRIKIKWKNVILLLISLCCTIMLIISITNIIKWKIDSYKTNKQNNIISNNSKLKKIKDSKNTELINQDNISEDDPYWDYIKMNMIYVDLKQLKKINNQTKGWIKVNGTNINYPFVQTKNNDYYLTHAFNKSYNNAGWIFLDYRNNIDKLNKNTIIYGHGRTDSTMFGSLKNILDSNWLNNSKNYIVKMSTEHEISLWQVFSVYRIPTTNDYLEINFYNDKNFLDFANMLITRSAHNFNTSINKNDKILTLSTCYNNNDKVVLHAKLIKKEKR